MDVLPEFMAPNEELICKELGIIFGKKTEDNKFLQTVFLPEGWLSTEGKEIWFIVDEKNRKRVKISHHAGNLYYVEFRYALQLKVSVEKNIVNVSVIKDEKVLNDKPFEAEFSSREEMMEESTKLHLKVAAWLDINYPDWRKVSAYWD